MKKFHLLLILLAGLCLGACNHNTVCIYGGSSACVTAA